MYKPTWQIYLNNTIAFGIYLLLRLFFGRNKRRSNRILFINTGQLGDLIVSSVIFTNQELLTRNKDIYLLIREQYSGLYDDYRGPINIIQWDYSKYKYNPLYRVSFLRKLRAIGFDTCVNVTAARGITNDEISLLSGAWNIYCLNNNWKYLTKLFGKVMDSHYDNIFSFGTANEPKRNVAMLEYLVGEPIETRTGIVLSPATEQVAHLKVDTLMRIWDSKKMIAIAPMSDGELRNWPIDYFKELCRLITTNLDAYITLLGTSEQRPILSDLSSINPERITNLAGEFSILESSVIVKMSDLFIGNDSGFTHIAKALGKQFIGIIGGGCYGLFFPYNESDRERLLFHQLDCFGCEWRCHLEKPYCIQNVSVERVYREVERFLAQFREEMNN